MSFADSLKKFGRPGFVPEGWYWVMPSRSLKAKSAQPFEFEGLKLVLYRGESGRVHAFEAHCPHMGAHLCDGTVEGDSIRCPFHYWKFSAQGECEHIPAQAECRHMPGLQKYKVAEKYGVIWLWTGAVEDSEPIPTVPELEGKELQVRLGSQFTKGCHPNVVMVNAIDAHHFYSVHNLPVELNLEPKELSPRCIQFSNTTQLPRLFHWARRFYKKALTYEMTYWWGHVGTVMVGPDFLHFYIMFALRPGPNNTTIGQTILMTPKRRFGFILNPILLFLTKLVGDYFAKGDTIIFSRIQFNFRTPIKADRTILNFVSHYEKQSPSAILMAREDVKAKDQSWQKPSEPNLNH